MLLAFVSGALLGLLNLGHCAGMCGPLAAAGCKEAGRTGLLRYQLGRFAGYGFAGTVCGHLGRGLESYASARWANWVFAALAASALVFVARDLVRDEGAAPLVQLRRSRSAARPWLRSLLRLLPRDPLPLGLLSVLLPCGLLAAALLAAVATGSPESGAAFMFGFAAVSGGALFAAAAFLQRMPRVSLPLRRGLATALLLGAAATIARPIAAYANEPENTPQAHHCH